MIPIGSYNPAYGVTLSLPSVVGREGVVRILELDLSEEERQALQRSAETLRKAVARMQDRRQGTLGDTLYDSWPAERRPFG